MTTRGTAQKAMVYIGIGALALGFLFGWMLSRTSYRDDDESQLRLGVGTFTNPLLECETGADSIRARKEDFTDDLQRFVANIKEGGGVSDVGVYFRDMNNGPVIGIGQNEPFIPASLLKVPLMIAYLRWADDDPSVLDVLLRYEDRFGGDVSRVFEPSTRLIPGASYSARSLIEAVIWESDNNAALMLYDQLPVRYQEDLYELVGIDPSIITDPVAALSVKHYSIFFRILFNASFLSHERSEYALELLSRGHFDAGLVAGVPGGTIVAHKFGERSVGDGYQQLHDCGIVYYPAHPYLLCVMTRGTDVGALAGAIQQISAFVYDRIDNQYKE